MNFYMYFITLSFYLYIQVVLGQYEDVRCKCVCPETTLPNSTEKRRVFVNTTHETSECKCENVVDKIVQDSQPNFCDRCECKWQSRNTKTIQVVIIIIICIISLLFLYMLFLLCLDPLMTRRPKTYQEHENEEDTQSIHRESSSENVRGRRPNADIMSRVEQEVSRVRGAQEKWKGTVVEQRRNIYDRHTMLN